MLCPKCGYISFDHLTSCQKCDNDLTVIGAELKGTSAQVEQYSFLNAVLREPVSADEAPVVVDEEDSALDSRVPEEDEEVLDLDEGTVEVEETLSPSADDTLENDMVDGSEEVDESELTVDLEEMAPLDLDSIEGVGDENESDFDQVGDDSLSSESSSEGEKTDTEELGLNLELEGEEGSLELDEDLDLEAPVESIEEVQDIEASDAEEVDELSVEDEDASGYEGLEIDPGSLSLDLDDIDVDESPDVETADIAVEETDEDELTIDLDQIDLSDLVHDSEKGSEQGRDDDSVASSEENTTELPQDEIVLTLEDDGDSSVKEGADDLTSLSVEDDSTDEIMLELDSVDDSEGVAVNGSDKVLDLSLESEEDTVIESLTDIIDLSLEDDDK